ncbi:YaaC family protein [Micromonospora sediminicola]|uniref:YaaC family protein n=1 Tax=Micromonospora sediminicola TaxID=946078 RepID=UPI0037BDBA15
MTVDRMLLRHALRKRRTSLASKTLLSSSSSRRGAFSAAMQQFEELMAASAAVGPASRPITLYYATAQAGLAVAAAHKTDPWSFSKHGLKPYNVRSSVADISIGPEGSGAFQFVAEATGSPLLHSPVTFGRLWSSIPDLADAPLSPAAPQALLIQPDRYAPGTAATVIVPRQNPGRENFAAHLSKILAGYPGIEGFAVVSDSYREIRESRWVADIRWNREVDFDRVAPEYRHHDDRFLRPSVNGEGNHPPSPFMTWWVMLYAYSMLSRYHPREWTAALNIDKSPAAHLLEYSLDLALDVIPHLVMDALDGTPTLFAKPLAF